MKRITRLTFLLIVLAVVSMATLAGCEKSAEKLQTNNPFDPAGPNGGDGLQIRAVVTGNSILLTWTQPADAGITFYTLFKVSSASGPFTGLAEVDHKPNTSIGSYSYKFPDPPSDNWFKVQATTADGSTSLLSLAVAAQADIGPIVIVGDTLSLVSSRFTPLTIIAAFGDSLLIGFDDILVNPQRFATTGPGLPTDLNFDFGPAAFDSTFHLKVLAFDNLSSTPTTSLELPVTFAPRHSIIDGNRLKLAKRINDLAIPSSGVVQMRFADSQTNLAVAPWLPGADIYPDYQLADSANPQEIWGEYQGDFGFTTTYSIGVRPDLLTTAAFQLKIPSNRVVSTPNVKAEFSAGATELRISENPNFAAVPWQAHVDSLTFQLTLDEGTKTIYTQFRNDWTQSNILSDYCILISQGADVNILVPADGAVVTGGSTILVRGTSDSGTVSTAIDTLQVDFGDGQGFREVIGTDDWQLNWNVPTFTEDTEVVLRARAVTDSSIVVTDFTTVTVTQLTVAILDPLENGTVISGDAVNIAGTAGGMIGGDPIDTVVIDIGLEQIVATGTALWSTTWTAADVLADTPTTIQVTAFAGTESVTSSVNIIIQPAP